MSEEKDRLLDRKQGIDASLAEVKLEIDTAKRIARADGVFLRPEKLKELEEKRAKLARLSQGLQRALSRMKEQKKEENRQIYGYTSRPALFMEAAERILTDEMFNQILEEAGL